MADDNKRFGIELGTTADTSGLEATERGLRDVEQAGRDASAAVNPMTDGSQLGAGGAEAIEEKAAAARELAADTEDAGDAMRELGTEAEAADPKLEKVIGQQRAQTMLAFGEALGRVALEVRSLAVNLQGADAQGAKLVGGLATGLESVSGALSGAAAGFAVGGPLGGAIGGMVGLMGGPLKNSITGTVDALKDLKTAQDNAKTAADNLIRTKAALQAEDKRNFLEKYFQDARREIDLATQAIERQQRVMAATSRADNAEREASQNAAARGGASAVGITGSDIAGDVAAQIAEIERSVTLANERADIAQKALNKAESAYNVARDSGAYDAAALAPLQKAIDDTRAELDNAKASITEAAQIGQQRVREVAADANDRLGALAQAAASDVGKIQEVVSQVETNHAEMSDAQKAALQRAKAALADGKITGEELQQVMADLRTILTAFRGGIDAQRGMNALYLEIANTNNENNSTLMGTAQQLKARVDNVERMLKTVLQDRR